jgi:hypothetical protein
MWVDPSQDRDVSSFLGLDGFVPPDERVFTLPIENRPDKIMLHSRQYPDNPLEPLAICRVMPNGEVFKGKDATLEDIALVLITHYGVNFAELAATWELEDAGYEADDA